MLLCSVIFLVAVVGWRKLVMTSDDLTNQIVRCSRSQRRAVHAAVRRDGVAHARSTAFGTDIGMSSPGRPDQLASTSQQPDVGNLESLGGLDRAGALDQVTV